MSKVITLNQPYAHLVVHGHKKQETRSWNTKYRGELFIHASMRMTRQQILLSQSWPFSEYIEDHTDLDNGAIIGRVKLYDVITSEEALSRMKLSESEGTQEEYRFGDYNPGRFVWLLSEPVYFNTVIMCPGQLGLWNADITEEDLKDMEVCHA